MKCVLYGTAIFSLFFVSCDTIFSPHGWPVTVSAQPSAIEHMAEHVKFTGFNKALTNQEKILLTFLDSPENVADALGKRNREGAHEWSTAEIYRVEPGRRVSVLCENGYSQKALYFRYVEAEKIWYRVSDLERPGSRGVAAVIVQ